MTSPPPENASAVPDSSPAQTPQLKPCPFCGAPAEVARYGGSYGYTSPSVWIKCGGCWLSAPHQDESIWIQGKGHIDVADGALQKAADVWNRRAPNA